MTRILRKNTPEQLFPCARSESDCQGDYEMTDAVNESCLAGGCLYDMLNACTFDIVARELKITISRSLDKDKSDGHPTEEFLIVHTTSRMIASVRGEYPQDRLQMKCTHTFATEIIHIICTTSDITDRKSVKFVEM